MPCVRNLTSSPVNYTKHTLAVEEERLLLPPLPFLLFLNDTVWIYLKCSQGNKDYEFDAYSLFSPQYISPPREEGGRGAEQLSLTQESLIKPLCSQFYGILNVL